MNHRGRLSSIFWLGAIMVVGAASFASGRFMIPEPNSPSASAEMIHAAQRSSSWGPDPIWVGWTGEASQFRQVRDRAFAFCFSNGGINRSCAEEQDESVHMAILALTTVEAQRRISDRSSLSDKERMIAANPDIVARARSYCWGLYNAHGGMDARLLSSCLSNLIETSQVAPLPVRD